MSYAFRTILLGTALGEESDPLARLALALARAAGARLHLVLAFTPTIGMIGELGVGIGDSDLLLLEEQRLRGLLAAQAERLGAAPGELAGTELVAGAPHRVLPEVAERIGADLLVVGATAGGALARLLGSTAERVLRKAGCPVLVVRGDLPVPPRRMLAPVDLSPLSAEAFRCGLAFAREVAGGGASEAPPEASPKALNIEALFVLSVVQRQVAPQFTPDQVDRFAIEELERFVALNAGEQAAGVVCRVRTGNPREEILAELAERPADLLVLGTHGLGGFDRLVIGSVASDVVREAPTSVLVVPPGARREP